MRGHVWTTLARYPFLSPILHADCGPVVPQFLQPGNLREEH